MAFKILKSNERLKKDKKTHMFVGRCEEKTAFFNNYNYLKRHYNEDESKVLAYYGFSNMGKSALCRELVDELGKGKYIYYDFEKGTHYKDFLYNTASDMKKRYGYSFSLYDYALYLYSKDDKNSKDSIKSSFLNYIKKSIGYIPEKNIVDILLEYANNDDVIIRKFLEKYRYDILELEKRFNEDISDDGIKNILLTCYAKNFIHNEEYENEPIVIFLDSYERVINVLNGENNSLNSDIWLRGVENEDEGLMLKLPNVLWVIASRERLKWDKQCNVWDENALEQHEINIFSEEEAMKLLNIYNIHDKRTCTRLHKLTKGNPKHLCLCAKKLKENTNIEDSANVNMHYDTLLDDFMRGMGKEYKNAILFINQIPVWTDRNFEENVEECGIRISKKVYEKIKQSGYVFAETNLRYEFEPYLKEIISKSSYEYEIEKINDVQKESTCTKLELINYEKVTTSELEDSSRYGERLTTEERTEFLNNEESSYGLVLYGAEDKKLENYIKDNIDILSLQEIYDNTHEKFEELIQDEKFKVFEKIFFTIWKQLENNKNTKEYVLFSKIYILYLKKYNKTEELTACLGVLRDNYDKVGLTDFEMIEIEDVLNISYFGLGMLQEAVEIAKSSYRRKKDRLGENHPATLNSLYAQAVLYSTMGRNIKALNINVESYARTKEVLGEEHVDTLANLDNLGNIYMALEMYEGALSAKKEIYEKYIKIYGKEHQLTLGCLQCIGKIYCEIGNIEKGEKILKTVYDKMILVYGDNSIEASLCMEMINECKKKIELSEADSKYLLGI